MSQAPFKCAMVHAKPKPLPRCEQECPHCRFLRTGEHTGQQRVPICALTPTRKVS